MKYINVGITVSDMDSALAIYRDFIGLEIVQDQVSDTVLKGSKVRQVILSGREGNLLELYECVAPKVKLLSRDELNIGFTGIKEVAFEVDDIPAWFEKVKAANYETTTGEPFEFRSGPILYKSFLFFDQDGNKVQMISEEEATVNKPNPVVELWAKPFWENCRKEKLTIQKCRDCGDYIFPAKLVCPSCLSENLDWVEASGKGKVYTFSTPEPMVMPYVLPDFASDPNFNVAVIELEEGVRMTSNVIECDRLDLCCDMPVEVAWEKRNEEFTMPQFKPVK